VKARGASGVSHDFLVVWQITTFNPARPVRGPKYVVKKGRTPVWTREDAKKLLDSNSTDSVSGLRNLALIGAMFYSYVRADGVRRRLRRHEKAARGRKCQCIIPWSRSLNEYILWTQAFRASNPLFQKRLNRYNACAASRKRAKSADFLPPVGCHTWQTESPSKSSKRDLFPIVS
jgi:integrase/recombinase XerD